MSKILFHMKDIMGFMVFHWSLSMSESVQVDLSYSRVVEFSDDFLSCM